jgi:hypothetical protein
MLLDVLLVVFCLSVVITWGGWGIILLLDARREQLASKTNKERQQRLTHKVMADGSVDWITPPVDRDRVTPPPRGEGVAFS